MKCAKIINLKFWFWFWFLWKKIVTWSTINREHGKDYWIQLPNLNYNFISFQKKKTLNKPILNSCVLWAE